MKKLLLLAAAAMLMFAACSDDDDTGTNPQTGDEKYFVYNVNNYWVYNYEGQDTDGNQVNRRDSAVVTAQEQQSDKMAYTVENYEDGEKQPRDSYFYAENDTRLYTLLGSLVPDSIAGIPIPISQEELGVWVKIADTESNSWGLDTIPVSIEDFNIEGIGNADIDGDLLIYAAKMTNKKSIEVMGETHDAQGFTLTVEVDAVASAIGVNADLKFSFVVENYYVDGIGRVQSVNKPFTASVKVFGADVPIYEFSGATSTMVDYSVSE
jgi:hypothetical protein